MISPTKLLFLIATCSLAGTGCSSQTHNETALRSPNARTAATPFNSSTREVQSASNVSLTDSSPGAQVKAKDFESSVPVTNSANDESSKVQARPSTAIEAIALVNLLEMPRLNEKNGPELESGATYLNYTGQGTLTEADSFYKELLESRGWKEIPPLTPGTDKYVDRLFEKLGYCLRVTLYSGSEPAELGIMLANLGNIDVRSLPKLPDAEVDQTRSNPVNVAYNSRSSISESADALLQKFTANGWQRLSEYQQSPNEVPHYRDLHFRKEACRLHVGVMKSPQDPSGKTTVFYQAESVMSFDIPTTGATQELKFDPTTRRATFGANNSRAEFVSLLRANSQKYGWKIGQTEKFETGEEHLVPIHVNSGAYVVARLVESGGKYFGSLESFASAPKKKQPEAELSASGENTTQPENTPPTKDASFDKFHGQIDSAIQAELSKAMSSINSPASSPKELEALQAMAQKLTEKLESDESADRVDSSDQEQPAWDPFDVPEDESAPPAEIRSIDKATCKLKFAGKSYELMHAACYVVNEYDGPTKCVIFSDSPIDVEMLKRELLEEGKPVYGWQFSKDATYLLCFQIKEYGVSIDANIGKLSMGIGTDKVESTLSYYQGKIAGKIVTTSPIWVGSEDTIEFAAELNQPVVQVDGATRNSSDSIKLVVDASKECLLPEGCSNFSSEGSRYNKKIEATIKAPIATVQAFYAEQLETNAWRETGNSANGFKQYRTNEQELELKLESIDEACKIELQIRDLMAAKVDEMLPPAGKAMLVLGNMSDSKVQMTIAGNIYQVSPSEGQKPKDATKVIVEPGSVNIQVTIGTGSQKFDMKVDATADSTWGVMFDKNFQDVLRLF